MSRQREKALRYYYRNPGSKRFHFVALYLTHLLGIRNYSISNLKNMQTSASLKCDMFYATYAGTGKRLASHLQIGQSY